jgi:anti-anti-sigma factor
MLTTTATQTFDALSDDQTLDDTVAALQRHGFSVEVVETLAAARTAALGRIPVGSSVMTNTSVTLDATGIVEAVDADGSPFESLRKKLLGLDASTQLQEMKGLAGEPDVAGHDVGSDKSASVVWAAGEIDISTVPRVWACLGVALERRRPVVLDLELVSFMDASAIPLLVEAQRRSTELGTSFIVRRPSRAVLRVLTITGLVDLVDIDGSTA